MVHDVVRPSLTLSEDVADRVRTIRLSKKISGRELAALMNKTPSWHHDRESHKTAITLNDAALYAETLGVRLAELLGIEPRILPPVLNDILNDIEDPDTTSLERRQLVTVIAHAHQMWREMRPSKRATR